MREVFQHDNARPHTARATVDFLAIQNVTVLPWLFKSLDLNPIEHLQSQYMLCPPLACNTARTRLGIDSINRRIRSCGIPPIIVQEPAAVLAEFASLVDDCAPRYRDEVLTPHMLPSMNLRREVFQHDNARSHTARATVDFLANQSVTVLS
jgi:hypothetical protein